MKKGPFWGWLVFSVSWCLYIIFNPPDGKQGTKFMAKLQGTPLPDWDAERYLTVSLAALLPPILIAGIWKALNWFVRDQPITNWYNAWVSSKEEQDKIHSSQEGEDK